MSIDKDKYKDLCYDLSQRVYSYRLYSRSFIDYIIITTLDEIEYLKVADKLKDYQIIQLFKNILLKRENEINRIYKSFLIHQRKLKLERIFNVK